MAKEEVKLLGTWSSPFVLRIKWALEMKGVAYEFIEEDLSNKSPLLLQCNPVNKKVPVLIHNGRVITESLIILEYIDETWKENPILPEDSHERAMACFWSKFGDDKVLPSVWTVFISQDKEREEAIATATENLKILETELNRKKFFGKDTIGLADLSLGWMTYMMVWLLEEIMDLKMIDEESFTSLSAWIQSFSESPVIKGSFPPKDRMLAKYRTIRQVKFQGGS